MKICLSIVFFTMGRPFHDFIADNHHFISRSELESNVKNEFQDVLELSSLYKLRNSSFVGKIAFEKDMHCPHMRAINRAFTVFCFRMRSRSRFSLITRLFGIFIQGAPSGPHELII